MSDTEISYSEYEAREPILFRHGASFLQPDKVGSYVRWTVEVNSRSDHRATVTASVNLADCNRVIEWFGYGPGGLEDIQRKLHVAICELRAMELALDAAAQAVEEYTQGSGNE